MAKQRNRTSGTTTLPPVNTQGENMSNEQENQSTDGSIKDSQVISQNDVGNMNSVLGDLNAVLGNTTPPSEEGKESLEGTNSSSGEEGGEKTSDQSTDNEPKDESSQEVIIQDPVTTPPPVNGGDNGAKSNVDEVAKAAIQEDGVQLGVFENRMAWVQEHGTTHEQHVVSVLNNYIEVCSSSVDLNKIGIEQQRLWRLFEYIHNQPAEFKKLFSIILEFAKKYEESVFSLEKLFRAQSALTISADKLVAFNNLRTLVINTIQSSNKQAVKALIDIRKIVENDAIPEHIRAGYVAFYN